MRPHLKPESMMAPINILLVLATAFSAAGTDLAGRMKTPLAGAKTFLINFFEWFGDLSIFCGRLARAALVPPFEFREFARQLDELGSKSLPLVQQREWFWPLRRVIVCSALGLSRYFLP